MAKRTGSMSHDEPEETAKKQNKASPKGQAEAQEAEPEVEEAADPDPEPEPEQVDDRLSEDPAEEEVNPNTPVQLEDLDPETELWEGGPLAKDVLAWKEHYGEIYITYFSAETRVIWHPLSRKEYRDLVREITDAVSQAENMSNAEANLINEDLTARKVVLWSDVDLDSPRAPGGMISTISNHAMEASGFGSIDVRQL